MMDFDKNPQALRQGAAAALTVAAVAAAMPAISHRAAEQRSDSAWAERVKIVQAALQDEAPSATAPGAPIVLASYTSPGATIRAFGARDLERDAFDRHAVAISTRVEETSAIAAFAPSVTALAAAKARAAEVDCLAQAIYYEARGESYHGQLAVAEVVVNRVRSKVYPDTFCGVVYQGSHRATGCQFTFTCDGSLRQKPRGVAWVRANVLASQVIAGAVRPMTHRATHYHTDEVAPYWSASLIETTRVGAHIFYRFPNRRERAQLAAIPPELEAEALSADTLESAAAATAAVEAPEMTPVMARIPIASVEKAAAAT